MKVAIIGCGYVGLTTGVALAELGNNIIMMDTVPDKLQHIKEGRTPFYEPGVDGLLSKHVSSGRMTTTGSISEAVSSSEVSFICVGTPSRKDGSMEDAYIRSAATEIGRALKERRGFHIVVVKSTVLPGTTEGLIKGLLEKSSSMRTGAGFGLVMCPEFLREGSAMHDSMHPDRVVIGTHDDRSFSVLSGLFSPLGAKVLRTTPTTAEMIKYTSNSLLATKISFSNEVSRICEMKGIDVYDVMTGVGMDFRISPHFLRAGVGFGGSCFPKDVAALKYMAKELGIDTPILDGVMDNNEIQPVHLVDVVEKALGGLKGARIAVLGLAFKPDTDDVRETRARPVIEALKERGAVVGAHDPKATENFRALVEGFTKFDAPDAAVEWADAVVILTEWPEYRRIDWSRKGHLKGIFDGRRSLDPAKTGDVRYWSIGMPLPEIKG